METSNQKSTAQKISVKTAAKLSGLSPHTLRAWEKRHAVVQPSREDSGRRFYTVEEVQKLKLLRVLTENGHSIGKLSTLEAGELAALQKVPEVPSILLRESLETLLQAVSQFNFELLDQMILKARVESPVRVFVLETVGPLVREVGNLVHQKKMSIAQEHAFSAVLRNHLGELLSQVQKVSRWNSDGALGKNESGKKDLPRLLFSTPEGDLHEFGILLAAVLSGVYGFKLRYLGPNMPAKALAEVAEQIGADIIVLGAVEADEKRLAQPLRIYMNELTQSLAMSSSKPVSIWLGGQCDRFSKKIVGESICYLDSLIDFETKLKEVKNEN